MARWGEFDFSDFVALRDRIEKLKNIDLDAFCNTVIDEIAGQFIRDVASITPYDTTTLKRAWTTVGGVQKIGDTYHIEIINPQEYAEFVEFGHRTRNHNKWVRGKFMLTLTERDLERNLDKIIGEKLKILLEGVIDGE